MMAALLLANLAIWPSAVLAEVLEHGQEAVQPDAQNPPVEPSAVHCKHGCAGHYGQHFQGQVPALSFEPPTAFSDRATATPEAFPPQHVPAFPFRPPLTASILS
jgi:hypothetical protein